MGPQVLLEACSGAGLPWSHSILWAEQVNPVVTWVPQGTSLGHRGTAASPWYSPQAEGKSLLLYLEHYSSSFFTDLGVWRAVALRFSHSALWLQLDSNFSPLSHLLSQRCCHRCWWPWKAAGPSWIQLALAFPDLGKLLAASHSSYSCGNPYQNLAT